MKTKHENPDSDENSAKYHTGHLCVTEGCENKAGTAWSKYWCWACNAIRLNRITASLEKMTLLPPKKKGTR